MNIYISTLAFALLGVQGLQQAHAEQSFSVAGAVVNSSVSTQEMYGVNVKYAYQLANGWGVVISSTFAQRESSANRSFDGDYSEFQVGPLYQFNSRVAGYALIGRGKLDITSDQWNDDQSAVSYGMGMRYQLTTKLFVDGGLVYTDYDDATSRNYQLGVGLRF